MASSLALTMVRGDTASWDIACTLEDGSAVDLTGATIYFTAKKSHADADSAAVFQKSTSDGIAVTDAANGKCRVTLTSADTSGLSTYAVTLYVDLEVVEADGNVATAAVGTLVVSPDVTFRIS